LGEEEELSDEQIEEMDDEALKKVLEKDMESEIGGGIPFTEEFSFGEFIPELLYREWIHRVSHTYTFVSSHSREQLYNLHRMDPNKYNVFYLAEKVGLSPDRVTAIIHLRRLEKDEEKKNWKTIG